MKVIGITGGAGSGKTYICQLLESKLGIPVIDSDLVARRLCEPGEAVYKKIVQAFTKNVCDPDGKLNRKMLAEIVFHDNEKLRLLNSITHPTTIDEIKHQLTQLAATGISCAFVESAIADQVNYTDFCDELWLVYASEETRRTRLMSTRGYAEEKVQSIMKNQSKNADFYRVCTRYIVNEKDTSVDELLRQIRFFLSL